MIFRRLGALLDRLEGLSGPSWTDLERSWAPKKSSGILEQTLPGVCRDFAGTLLGYFSSGDPQGPPRARELEILLTSYRRSEHALARWAGEFVFCFVGLQEAPLGALLSRLGGLFEPS